MNNYVKQGIELACQTYKVMADGESIGMSDGTVSCPTYDGVPLGHLVYGLYVPVMTDRADSMFDCHNYMEIVGATALENPSDEELTIIHRNTPAYIWFAKYGQAVLERLAKRHNNAIICLQVPLEVKVKLEDLAAQKGCSLNDLIALKVESFL